MANSPELEAEMDKLFGTRDNPIIAADLDKNIPDSVEPIEPAEPAESVELIESEDVEDEYIENDDNFASDEEEESQDGFMGYEDWVASGKDPKDFKGENAFFEEGERVKRHDEEMKAIRSDLKNVVNGVNDIREQDKIRIRTELEAEFNNAKEDGDIDSVLDLQKRISELDGTKEERSSQINPAITNYIKGHPVIDRESVRFNAEFYEDMVTAQAHLVREFAGDDSSNLTPKQVHKIMDLAYENAKKLNPTIFKSRKNERSQKILPIKKQIKPQPKEVNVRQKLGNLKISRSNPQDRDAIVGMYDMIEKRSGKEAAENFGKNYLVESGE